MSLKYPQHEEPLAALKDFKVGIDADLLLSTVRQSDPLTSLHTANASLDNTLLSALKDTLQKLNKNFGLKLVVVMSGLRPPCLHKAEAGLENSHHLWSNVNKLTHQTVIEKYGSQFYQQELAVACEETNNDFFVAPYTASAQLASFFKEMMINVCFGSFSLLGFDEIDQAIVKFDVDQGKFWFVDRADTKCGLDQLRTQIVEAAILYPECKYHEGHKEQMLWHLSNGLSLNSDRQLCTISGKQIEIKHLGVRFNDDVYYFMSQRLLDVNLLSMITHQQHSDAQCTAPSFFLRFAQLKSDQFKSLLGYSIQNLCNEQPCDNQWIESQRAKNENKAADWLITDENIQEEQARNEGIEVSFNFALSWLKSELQDLHQLQKTDKLDNYQNNRLLAKIYGENEVQTNLVSCDQLLATNYFRFLEAQGYMRHDRDYLFGDLIGMTPQGLEEPMLILLQMMRVKFPGGFTMDVPKCHQPFVGAQKSKPHQLLIRVLSLFPYANENVKVDIAHTDYDLSAFASYAALLKQHLQFMFQSILVKLFAEGKTSLTQISTFHQVVSKLAFTKRKDSALRGYLIHRYLSAKNEDWHTACKLTKPNEFVKDSIARWQEVMKLIAVCKNDELIRHFQEADYYFRQNVSSAFQSAFK